ncbi:MAG TPA: PAS domain S-box protein, partial [Nitrospiraceae bacterium]|nr:PAS domain S-box protein [Nitrospiraceae bacterium]
MVTRDSMMRRQADERLRESAEHYRTLFELAPIAVYSCDASGVVREYNQRAAELWGRSPQPGDTGERFCGSFKMYRPDGSLMPHEQCPMGDVLSGRVPGIQNGEVHIERPDGSRVIVIVNIAPVADERGSIVGAINCFYDVTDRIQVEETRARLAAIVESSDDAIISTDLNGIITSWNRGAERLYGYTAQEMIGRPVSRLIPADRHDEELTILDRIRHGKMIDHYETVRCRKDATRLDISLTVSPLINASGQIVGASKIARDITERKRAEQRLRASEARYRHLYEAIDEGFCVIQMVFDANKKPVDYIFLEVNPAFETQTGIVNARGRSMRAIALHHEDHWFKMFGQVALTGEPTRFQYPAAELHRWYEGYAYRLGEAHERKVAILFNDISARKRTEERLQQFNEELESRVAERTAELNQSQQRLRDLAAALNVTEQRERQRLATDLHDELGQLLSVTRIRLDQARRQPMEPSLAKMIVEMQTALDKALRYTRTLVSQLSPPMAEFDLPMALQWLTEHMQQQNLSVFLHVKGKILPLPEDHALLVFQSVRELLHNCVKHARTHEAIMILQQVGSSVHLTVSDQGCGFDPSTLASGCHSAGGGFGLFSIYERMGSIGGRFDLESKPGTGTSATLIVPLTDGSAPSTLATGQTLMVDDATRPLIPDRTAERANHSRIRVLVADDHVMVRQGLCGLLKEHDHIEIIGEAANGQEAVALARQLQPDIILMDVTMPKMDGIVATRQIKAQHPGMIVIGLSVNNTSQVEAAMKEAGAAGFLNKEAAVDQLLRMIQAA